MQSANNYLLKIKVVAFDFDQTLVDEMASLRNRWAEVISEFSHIHPAFEETFFSVFDAKGIGYKAHLDDALEALGLSKDLGLPIIERFRATSSNKEFVYEGARETVSLLKEKGLRVGVITDGRQNYQEGRINITGLSELLDFVYYGDVHQKPDPASFLTCIDDEKIQPSELLYIGDHIEKDIEGALAVGANACYLGKEHNKILPQEAISFETMYQFHQWLKQK